MLDDRQTESIPAGERDGSSQALPRDRAAEGLRPKSRPDGERPGPPPVSRPGDEPRDKPDSPREQDERKAAGGGEELTRDDNRKKDDEIRKSRLRRRLILGAGALLVLVGAPAGYLYWDNISHFESTDDAFIAARQIAVAPKVAGYVVSVPVTDNDHVSRGEVIARIDDRDYRVALDQANAQVDAARGSIGNIEAQIAVQQAQVGQADAQIELAQAALVAAQKQVDALKAQRKSAEANLAQTVAQSEQAALNLSYTLISAEQSGRIANLIAGVGQYATVGTALTMFVPDDIWVTANFKETQLDAMRPGQPVTMSIDAYPERLLHGHVASVQPGSGTAFSLLPAENATGNYVKIVQRVPVKIVMDQTPGDITLGPGMSVVPTVRTNPAPSFTNG